MVAVGNCREAHARHEVSVRELGQDRYPHLNSFDNVPSAFSCALFLVIAMACAGVIHVLWMRLAPQRWLAAPLDGGLTVRGRRLLGANKRWRGIVALPLAAALSFAALGLFRESLPAWLAAGMWPLSTRGYALLGAVAGLACMLAELPNSFVKRQLGIAPGELPARGPARYIFGTLDRIDSPLGVALGVSALVPVTAATWLWLLILGTGAHAGFSAALHAVGAKSRAF